MRMKLYFLLLGAALIASGCARKCPPCPACPMTGAVGSFNAPVSDNSLAASNQAASSPYDASASRYVKK